ncbi:MAG: preprotein translocase subunit YajC [Clostridia bacterium]
MDANTIKLLVMYALIFAVFYFIMVLPQRRKNKKLKAMLDDLKVGDEIITIGGIYGKITGIKEDVLTIEVGADKTKLRVARWSVRSVESSVQ